MSRVAGWVRDNYQAITAVAAMLVSLIALFVAWDQSRVMRAQQHGAVVPALQIDGFTSQTDGRLAIGVNIRNNGVGPAFVETVSARRDGIPQDNIDALILAVSEPTRDRSWTSMQGRVMAPGEVIEAARFAWPADKMSDESLLAIQSEWVRWHIEICYCSVFHRCWRASSNLIRPAETPSCPDPGVDLFELVGESDAIPLENSQTTPEMSPDEDL